VVAGTLDDVDAWITTDAWWEVTAGRADRDIGTAELLASSPVVVAVDPARTTALTGLCGGQAIFACLGAHAGEPWGSLGGEASWGTLEVGLPDADTSTGLSVLASAAIGYVGGAEFAANEFDDAFRTWLTSLAAASHGGDPDPANTLVVRRGTYSAAGTTAARLSTIPRPVDRLDASPATQASIVVVRFPGGDEVPGLAHLRDNLVAAGWAPAAGEPAATLKPGVLAALHTLWTEVAR
jgi:hypothetical protein